MYLECRCVEGLVWGAECSSEMGQTQEGLTLSVEYLRGVSTALSTGDTEADENIMALLTWGQLLWEGPRSPRDGSQGCPRSPCAVLGQHRQPASGWDGARCPGWTIHGGRGNPSQGVRGLPGTWRWTRPPKATCLCPPAVPPRAQRPLTGWLASPSPVNTAP